MNLSEQLLKQLTPYELETLIDLANQLLKTKLVKTSTSHEVIEHEFPIDVCPHCGSKYFIKHGHRNGVQRYLCKNDICKKTFGATNETCLYSTHLPYETWIHFIACELLHLTLLETSQIIGVSKTGCFNLRHKFYGALGSLKKNETSRNCTDRCHVFANQFKRYKTTQYAKTY